MELLTNAVVITATAFIMDFGWAEDLWDSVGGGWDSIVVGILVASIYQVIRYQGQKRIKTYMGQINPKIQQIVTAANRIANSDEDKVA
jgi:hypothetical protein